MWTLSGAAIMRFYPSLISLFTTILEYAVNEMDIIDVVKVNRQINDFFADAVDNSADELDTYSELLSYGYTVAQIRKYCGNEMGTHMEIFCRAHGLL